MTNRVSGFHTAGLSQLVQSTGTGYQYRIQGGLIRKTSGEGCKSWHPNQFLDAEIGQGYAIIVFKAAVCYLPFRSAGEQPVINFVRAVEKLAASQ